MKINQPNETQKAALRDYTNPDLHQLAQKSNNSVTNVHTRQGMTFCKLNGETIRASEAHKLLSELFEG